MSGCHRSSPVSPVCMLRAASAHDTSHVVAGSSDASQGGKSEGPLPREDDRARQAIPLTEVPEPSPAEVARHNLTHLPYRRWCRWCVMARRANAQHRTLPSFSRQIPLLVLDFCFLKHAGEERWLCVLVGRLYPSRAMFGAPCSKKGPDGHTTARLASFLRACGVARLTYMCDQEGALRTCV